MSFKDSIMRENRKYQPQFLSTFLVMDEDLWATADQEALHKQEMSVG